VLRPAGLLLPGVSQGAQADAAGRSGDQQPHYIHGEHLRICFDYVLHGVALALVSTCETAAAYVLCVKWSAVLVCSISYEVGLVWPS